MFNLFEILALLGGGFAAGIGNTLVGGGSLFSLPVLLLLGYDGAEAIGTNRFAVVFLAASGALSYRRRGSYSAREALPLAGIMAAGAAIGAAITVSLADTAINTIVLVLLYAFGVLLFFKPKQTVIANAATADPSARINFSRPTLLFPLLALGIYGGFIGIAVTTMTVILLSRTTPAAMTRSLGLNQVSVFALSVVASIVFWLNGAIAVMPALILAVSMAAGAWVGPAWAERIGERRLEIILKIFVLFLIVNATIRIL